eukprot:TRINITY_DN11373_c0_g1_i3.p1 TRINITY_DN11373_c0_g1~~TRINITY_DN11373_c0_g1_i3.p1  ORF type:complete len:643 (-),score=134.11 TRINITY_DN11373_c0_g1_i3:248-2176(-)
MDRLREHSEKLLDQVLLVSQELIRVAITWGEQWYNALEDASSLYFVEGVVEPFIEILKPFHHSLNQGCTTLMETAFHQSFSSDLKEAENLCEMYKSSGNIAYINQAWAHYYQVFKLLSLQLPKMKTIELKYSSPKLEKVNNLDLAIPGTYFVGRTKEMNKQKKENITRIARFQPNLPIIPSKQRPRKLGIISDVGKEFTFLLKGHEDLRQDERVMQLFGLINNLLANNRSTARYHIGIRRYSVIPLSPTTGLIGWVPNCDTLNELITEYRKNFALPAIPPKDELRVMDILSSGNYETLRPIQRIEIFNATLRKFNGNDLNDMMWLRSPNSEAWLERRTNYTRTMAVMSMAGYILGLGDRHPNNIMIERHTGHVVHIDFGDCFEVAMLREKAPEKVPFRLTRLCVKAMEVSGIEGNFRTTCELVMSCLRCNRDSLMAVLEAFVHDPLITWRLVEVGGAEDNPEARIPAVHQTSSISSDRHSSNSTTNIGGKNKTRGGSRPGPNHLLGSKKQQGFSLAVALFERKPQKFAEINTEKMSVVSPLVSMTASNMMTMTNERRGAVLIVGGGGEEEEVDVSPTRKEKKGGLNEKALSVVNRVKEKLTGTDFQKDQTLSVEQQVRKLIAQATSVRNLCQGYYQGWCPFY